MSIDVIFDRKYFTGGYKFIIGRFYVDIRSNITTPRRVALARMFKEAGLRSPRTQLTKVQIEISVLGRRTEATRDPIPHVVGCGLTSHFGDSKIPIRDLPDNIILM